MENFYHQRERFNKGPNRYIDAISNPNFSSLIKRLITELELASISLNYLDVGCGDCRGTKILANFLQRMTQCEVKPYGIDIIASSKDSDVLTSCIDLNTDAIPFTNFFHIVTVFETIEHIFNVDFMLESLYDSLVKQGLLIVTTLNVVCWKNRILVPLGIQPMNTEVSTKKLSYGYKLPFLKKHVSQWRPSGHIRPFTMDSLAELLADNHFEIVYKFGLENWPAMKFLERVAKSLCTGIGVIGVKK
jgi:SAM-dependent methyltransferase